MLPALLIGIVFLACPARSWAQLGMDKDPFGKVGHEPPQQYNYVGSVAVKAGDGEPYGGQIYCLVTGIKLGLKQEAMPVQTTIGEEKPSMFGKWFGQKGKPGGIIYVCCPTCAEKVRGNPQAYYARVVMDKSMFSFNYTSAPSERPAKPSINPTGPSRHGIERTAYTGAVTAQPPAMSVATPQPAK